MCPPGLFLHRLERLAPFSELPTHTGRALPRALLFWPPLLLSEQATLLLGTAQHSAAPAETKTALAS